MNAIIEYAQEFQYREIKAGRNPSKIRLTREQIDYLEDWLKESGIIFVKDPTLDGKQRILGMEVIAV